MAGSVLSSSPKRGGIHLGGIKHERTDSCVRAYICTLVALDTVLFIPLRHESRHAALLIAGRALLPCTVFKGP